MHEIICPWIQYMNLLHFLFKEEVALKVFIWERKNKDISVKTRTFARPLAKWIMCKVDNVQGKMGKEICAKNDVLGWCTKKKEMSDKSTLCISLQSTGVNWWTGPKMSKRIWKEKLTGDNLSFHDVQRCGLGVLDLRWDTALVEYI